LIFLVTVTAAILLLMPLVWRSGARRRLDRLGQSLAPPDSSSSTAAVASGASALSGPELSATLTEAGFAAGPAGVGLSARAVGLELPMASAGLDIAAGGGGSRGSGLPGGLAGPVEGRRARIVIAVVVALAVAGLIGSWWALPVGAAAGAGAEQLLRRHEPAAQRRERLAAVADLPLGADLLAAALRAGAPLDRAAAAVAEALGGPLGERLRRTARSLRLGAEPAEAWEHLAGIDGADRLVAAAIRSSASGGALAGALGRLADDLRADRAVAAKAAAERAGVLIVLPLGLCFLPAFLLAGLVPVLIAVLGDVL
jgi:Flp pilus assembly protein TadB